MTIDNRDPDRYLTDRDGVYYYKRRVPKQVVEIDGRSSVIKISLKTRDLAKARAMRDGYERADEDLWAALLSGEGHEAAKLRYDAAVKRAAALGFVYRPSVEILQTETAMQMIDRLRAMTEERPASAESRALSGTIDKPKVLVSEAFQLYVDKISVDETRGKSEQQKKDWLKVKKRALANFIALNEDIPISDITHVHANKVYEFWANRIAPPDDENGKKQKPSHSPSSGNRDLGNMRVLFEEYHRYEKIKIDNPFDGLSFSEKFKVKRPPFPVEWITDRIMKVGALARMNAEARGIALAMIETGARPSELANLRPENIFLTHPVPHIAIEPRLDPEDPREIKTVSSIRKVPLVGISLAVFQKHKNGFPRYRERDAALSGALNNFFKSQKPSLFPTKKHKIYSLRHSFEDRMKEGRLDTELRMILMGHSNDRPEYGEGGSLKWRQEELLKIVLPFDPAIV